MAIETDTERAIFLNTDEFGVSATFTPDGGSPSTISVLLENPYFKIEGEESFVEESKLGVFVRDSDVLSIAHGDEFVINSVTFQVKEVMPDGQGMTLVGLEKQ